MIDPIGCILIILSDFKTRESHLDEPDDSQCIVLALLRKHVLVEVDLVVVHLEAHFARDWIAMKTDIDELVILDERESEGVARAGDHLKHVLIIVSRYCNVRCRRAPPPFRRQT